MAQFFLLGSQTAMVEEPGFTDTMTKNLPKTFEERLLRCESLFCSP